MEEIVKALELKIQLDNLRPIDKEHEAIIMQKFRLDWNYHSNHLEGNSLTYGETKALILFGITAQGKPLKDTLEITGHNEAIDWVHDMVKGERPLTENFIRELHVLLLKEPYETDAITAEGHPTKKRVNVGSYKSTPNHVKTLTGEIFRFATPEETPAKMTDLLNWYSEKINAADTNAILLATEFHYRFIRIHPFDDGNGRTARILMNFILMQFGFPPVIIKTEDKANYFAALQLADAGNLEAFVNYIGVNLIRSLEIMIRGANGESIEDADDLDKEIALIEQKLTGFGNRVEKVKTDEIINNIYNKSIRNIAGEIQKKLQKFDNHYLNKNINFFLDNQMVTFPNGYANMPRTPIAKIRVAIIYDTLKIKGLEDFKFSYNLIFEFDMLKYSIYEEHSNEIIMNKNYENLTQLEIENIVKVILKKHNSLMNSILKK